MDYPTTKKEKYYLTETDLQSLEDGIPVVLFTKDSREITLELETEETD